MISPTQVTTNPAPDSGPRTAQITEIRAISGYGATTEEAAQTAGLRAGPSRGVATLRDRWRSPLGSRQARSGDRRR